MSAALFDWANGSGAENAEPDAAIKAAGFQSGTPLVAAYLNWVLSKAAEASSFAAGWPDAASFVDGSTAGDLGIIVEDLDTVGGVLKASATPTAADCVAVAVDGRRVFAGHRVTSTVYQYARTLSGSAVTYTLSQPLASPVRIVRCDTRLLVAYNVGGSGYVDCFTVADSGTGISAAWTYTAAGGQVNDVAALAALGSNVATAFVATEAGSVVPIPLSTGTAGTAYSHGAAVRGLAAHGSAVYLNGSPSSSVTMRRLAFVLGGLVDYTTGGVDGPWDRVDVPTALSGGRLAADARGLVLAWGSVETSGATIEERSSLTGEVVSSRVYDPGAPLSSACAPVALAIDDEAAFMVTDDPVGAEGGIVRFDRGGLVPRWRHLTSPSAPVRCYAVASDGVAVFVGVDTTSSTVPLRRLYRGGQPRMVRRVTQTGLNLLPFYEVVTTDREGGQPVAAIAGFDGRVGALRLASAQTHRIDISPIDGTPQLGALLASMTSTPPYVYPDAGVSVTLETTGTLRPPPLVLSSPGYALTWTITSVVVAYYRASVGNTASLSLYRWPRSGVATAGSAVVTLNSASHFTTTGAWAEHTESLSVTLDWSQYVYRWYWVLASSGGGDHVRIGAASVLTSVRGVF